MGLEFINQPQVFTAGITALAGIQGALERYPLLTSYYSWTSTANVSSATFPIPIALGYFLPNPESFLVTVGGVLQPPTTYSIDSNNRFIVFSSPVSADIEVAVTQLATASPSSQNFDLVKSNFGTFTTLSALSAKIEALTLGSDLTPNNIYLPTGEIGIGLDQAGTLTKLHVKAAENDQISITNSTTPASSWRLNVSDINGLFYLFDFDNNTQPLRIEKRTPTNTIYTNVTGVGIGNSTPNQKLTVSGSISATGFAATNSLQTNLLTVSGNTILNGSLGIGVNVPESRFNVVNGKSTFAAAGNEYAIAVKNTATGNPVFLGASSDTNPHVVLSNSASAALVTFQHGGNVGIGTTTPTYKLDVIATGNAIGGSRVLNQSTGSSAHTVLQIGNDTNGAAAAIRLNSSNNTGGPGGANALSIIQGLPAPLVISTNNTERVRIDGTTGDVTFQGNIITVGDIRGTGALEIVTLSSTGFPAISGFTNTYTSSPSACFPDSMAIKLDAERSYEIEYNLYYYVNQNYNDDGARAIFTFQLSGNRPTAFSRAVANLEYNCLDGTAITAPTIFGNAVANSSTLAFRETSPIIRRKLVNTRIQSIVTTTVACTANLFVQARNNVAAYRTSLLQIPGTSRRVKWITAL